jgi:hypothetical protein
MLIQVPTNLRFWLPMVDAFRTFAIWQPAAFHAAFQRIQALAAV